ncbi:hypothetical protein HMPREF1861_00873 [Corynebacterium kroppenstedtii]|nr:hypothetical protein HMPREF1861_00873 [Corynebacterium kroppenstedtii]
MGISGSVVKTVRVSLFRRRGGHVCGSGRAQAGEDSARGVVGGF